jgi:dihydrofolate synthase/folylpolyglutamate synthase
MRKINKLQFKEAVQYLYSFINLEKDPVYFSSKTYKLDRMAFLLDRFSNPQVHFKVIHLAGSKAKGSTAAFIASVLFKAGKKTGLYTSPHVSSILERIVIDQKQVDEELFIHLVCQIKDFIEYTPLSHFPNKMKPTFFELLTLLCWLAFREAHCEYVVLETGLGGRLDATNIVEPLATVITPIEIEHEDILGKTIEKIAREKCGIMKINVPVFCAKQVPPVKKVIKQEASLKKADLFMLEDELAGLDVRVSAKGTEFAMKLKNTKQQQFSLKLLGDFQAENAALAYLTLHTLMPDLSMVFFRQGFANTFLPGRMEVLRRKPLIIVDGAHTPGSINRSLACFLKLVKDKGILVFAAVKGKRIKEMAEQLAPHFQTVIISTPGFFRHSEPQETCAIFKKYHPNVSLDSDPLGAFKKAVRLAKNKLPILITGSLYFAAELRLKARKLIPRNS